MREVLHYLDVVENHACYFDYDIDSGSDGPVSTDEDILTVSKSIPSAYHRSTEY